MHTAWQKTGVKRSPRAPVASRAFTIVELLVILVVLSILMTISVIGIGSWRTRTAKTEVRTSLLSVASIMKQERNFKNAYPTSIPSGAGRNPNVQLTYVSGNASGYCVEATSTTATSIIMHISAPAYTPTDGDCS